MAASTDLPLNADFEAGFADEPEGVARNVALAVLTGVPRGDATNCVALKLRSGI
jgi:2-methylisocitrate lyase-like PEP mutase family enzyme